MQTQRRIGTISRQLATAIGQLWTTSPRGRTTPSADQASPPCGRHLSSSAGRGSRIFLRAELAAAVGGSRPARPRRRRSGHRQDDPGPRPEPRGGRSRLPRPGRVLLRPDQHPAVRPVARPVRGMPARSGPARAPRRLRRRPAGAGHRPGRALRRGAAIPGRARRHSSRPSSSSRTSTGPTRPASTSCATSVPTCGTGRSCCWRPTGSTS